MISIVIPCYEMRGRGIEFLSELLDSISFQTFTDYEIIISDNSHSSEIFDFITTKTGLNIRYFANPGNNATQNLNNAIDQAFGDIIKPMFQDDKFMNQHTLQNIVNSLSQSHWAVCVSNNRGDHDWIHTPWQSNNYSELLNGLNTFGSPSAVAFLNSELRFDEKLMWLMDCEFYARLLKKFGEPALLPDEIFIRQWEGQITKNEAVGQVRITEAEYVFNKHQI